MKELPRNEKYSYIKKLFVKIFYKEKNKVTLQDSGNQPLGTLISSMMKEGKIRGNYVSVAKLLKNRYSKASRAGLAVHSVLNRLSDTYKDDATDRDNANEFLLKWYDALDTSVPIVRHEVIVLYAIGFFPILYYSSRTIVQVLTIFVS